MPTPSKKVVIAGGGVVGAATAYYLAVDHGIGATVVDRSGLAAAASGRAGGFLARDWNDGSPTQELTRVSFDLHAELGEALPTTDYRRLKCEAVAIDPRGKPSNQKLKDVECLYRSMGGPSTIAQVHPRKLVEAMMQKATTLGASFRQATVQGFVVDDNGGGVVRGLQTDDGVIEADAVVVAMGPWTHAVGLKNQTSQCDVRGWGIDDMPPIVGTKYHSVVVQAPAPLETATFFQGLGDPEVYPRPDGEVYITGFPDPAAVVHDLPGETEVRSSVCDRLHTTIQAIAPDLAEAPVTTRQACHLPSAPDGVPLIGPIPNRSGAFVATGHGCWGILLAPATGKALAELIATGRSSSVDLSPFDPRRFSLNARRSFF